MYSTLNTLLNYSVQKLPACSSNATLSNQFAHYFSDKVSNIRSELDEQCVSQSNVCSVPSENIACSISKVSNISCASLNGCNVSSVDKCNVNCTQVLESFANVSDDEVKKLISKLPNKTSPLDPIPTWLLKQCVDTLLPVIKSIINIILSELTCSLLFSGKLLLLP
jgi:hypothetical protein